MAGFNKFAYTIWFIIILNHFKFLYMMNQMIQETKHTLSCYSGATLL
jgi:hypothetical protein